MAALRRGAGDATGASAAATCRVRRAARLDTGAAAVGCSEGAATTAVASTGVITAAVEATATVGGCESATIAARLDRRVVPPLRLVGVATVSGAAGSVGVNTTSATAGTAVSNACGAKRAAFLAGAGGSGMVGRSVQNQKTKAVRQSRRTACENMKTRANDAACMRTLCPSKEAGGR